MSLPFDLLSDWDRDVSKKYGAFNYQEKVSNRVSFLLDKKGVIRFKQSASLTEPRDFEDIMKKVEVIESE